MISNYTYQFFLKIVSLEGATPHLSLYTVHSSNTCSPVVSFNSLVFLVLVSLNWISGTGTQKLQWGFSTEFLVFNCPLVGFSKVYVHEHPVFRVFVVVYSSLGGVPVFFS